MKKKKQLPLSPLAEQSLADSSAWCWPWLLIVLVWFLWWAPVITGEEQLYIRDLTFYALPMKTYMVESFQAGQFPFWTPYISAGMPFLADPSHQVLYPPNLLFFFTPTIQQGISWFVILHHLLGMLGFWFLGRSLRAGVWISTWAALLYGLSGYSLSVLDNVNYLTAVAWVPLALAFFIRGLTDARLPDAAMAALCVAMMVLAGDTFHPMYLGFFCGLLVLLRTWSFHWRGDVLLPGSSVRFSWIHLVVSFGLAGLLAAAQILPTLALLRHSVRQEALTFEEVTLWSFPPQRLVEIIHPFFYGSKYPLPHFIGVFLYPRFNEPWVDSVFLGIIPLVLGILWTCLQFRRALPWLALIVLALLLSFAYYAPYYPALLQIFPLLSFHRYQEKFVYFSNFGLCVAAMMGAVYLFANPTLLWERLEKHSALVRGVASLAILIITPLLLLKLPADWWIWPYALFRSEEWGSFFYQREPHVIALFHHWILMLALLIPLLWLQKDWYKPYLRVLLLAALLDVGVAHFHHVPTAPTRLITERPTPVALQIIRKDMGKVASESQTALSRPVRIFYDDLGDFTEGKREPDTLARVAQAYGQPGLKDSYPIYWPYRVLYNQQRLLFNFGIIYNVRYLNGRFAPLQPKNHRMMDDLLLRLAPNLLMSLSGVRYIVSPIHEHNEIWDSSDFTEVGRDRPLNLRVLRVNNPVPQAYLAPNALWNDEPMAVFRIITEQFRGYDPTRQVELSPARLDNPEIPLLPGPNAPPEVKEPVKEPAIPLQPSNIRWQQAKPGNLALSLDSPYETAHLVVTESFFPGWTATVDGHPAELFLANQRFMAVKVPQGKHTVTLRYDAPGFVPGIVLSVLGLLLFLGCFYVPRCYPQLARQLTGNTVLSVKEATRE